MSNGSFSSQMLEATFAFARLAITNAVLLNGAAAAALLAFLSASANAERAPLTRAIICFGWGALLGGAASVLAYIGQRLDWQASRSAAPRSSPGATVLIVLAVSSGMAAYFAFLFGVIFGSSGLK